MTFTKFEVGRPIHSWPITFLMLIRYVTLWPPLTTWPWTFQYIACHKVKVCTKFERNGTIRGELLRFKYDQSGRRTPSWIWPEVDFHNLADYGNAHITSACQISTWLNQFSRPAFRGRGCNFVLPISQGWGSNLYQIWAGDTLSLTLIVHFYILDCVWKPWRLILQLWSKKRQIWHYPVKIREGIIEEMSE